MMRLGLKTDQAAGTSCTTAFWRDRRGTTSIEYSIIAAGIALVIIAVVGQIGQTLIPLYEAVLPGLQ